jgi:hypothetical protein
VQQARAELAAELVADLRRVDALLRETKKKLAVAVRASGTSLTGLSPSASKVRPLHLLSAYLSSGAAGAWPQIQIVQLCACALIAGQRDVFASGVRTSSTSVAFPVLHDA